MIKKLLLLTFLTFTLNLANAQTPAFKQYFDGADTSIFNSVIINLDTSSSNIWQVGPPQKTIFDSAATIPNVLVTDTIHTYPVNNTSSFSFKVDARNWGSRGIMAVRWKQKLDMDSAMDGGTIESSTDSGKTWINVFTDPKVYNFYGFDSLKNKDTLSDGTYVFTGTDTVWRDIWLCYKLDNQGYPNFMFRFTFRSDSVDNNREGWMIDNMMVQLTFFHTVSTVDLNGSFLVYPTITNGIIKIAMGDTKAKIESILILDAQGQIVKRQNGQTDKATIDISNLANGNYFVHVQSGKKIEVHKVLLNH